MEILVRDAKLVLAVWKMTAELCCRMSRPFQITWPHAHAHTGTYPCTHTQEPTKTCTYVPADYTHIVEKENK